MECGRREATEHWSCLIDKELLSFSTVSSSGCSIFRVPNLLHQTNETAYEPRIISIGPYHCRKEDLVGMRMRKMHYLRRFIQRRKETSVQRYVMALNDMEEEIRKCYAEPLDDDFRGLCLVEMMLLDGCFIIELIREYSPASEVRKKKVNFHNITLASITRDLLLVENQLPFLVLSKLIQMTPEPNEENVEKFILMVLHFFSRMMPGPGIRPSSIISAENIKNLLDLVRVSWLASSEIFYLADRYSEESGEWHLGSATELQRVGIKFKKIDQVMSLFDIKFENGVLFIPTIRMDDDTDSILRNLIAHEQCHNNYPRHVSDYVTFMDCLIKTGEDVELLRHSRIIANELGDDEVVATIFNRLGHLVDISDENLYLKIYIDVKKYCDRGWNAWMAKWDVWMANLRHNYFNTPWALILFLAAVFLLILMKKLEKYRE